MKTLANATILGIVGKDPEIKPTKGGMVLCAFPVATTVRKKDPNGEYFDATLWHNVVGFGKLAENIQKTVAKGSKIYLTGSIDYQEYQGSDGTQKTSTKVIISDFSVISKSEYQQSREQLESIGNKKQDRLQDAEDLLPF